MSLRATSGAGRGAASASPCPATPPTRRSAPRSPSSPRGLRAICLSRASTRCRTCASSWSIRRAVAVGTAWSGWSVIHLRLRSALVSAACDTSSAPRPRRGSPTGTPIPASRRRRPATRTLQRSPTARRRRQYGQVSSVYPQRATLRLSAPTSCTWRESHSRHGSEILSNVIIRAPRYTTRARTTTKARFAVTANDF